MLQRRQAVFGWLFVAPALVLLLAVGLAPLGTTVYYSFTNASTDAFRPPEFIGLGNYAELFRAGAFWRAVVNTLIFTAGSVALESVLGLFFALIVHSKFHGRGLVRGAMLIPWALPTVVAARMWDWMLNDQFGVINDLFARVIPVLPSPLAWTGQDGLAMLSVILVDTWKTTPFVALLLLAGLQLIPDDLYEAADVDGARPVQQFFTITLPLLKPAILVALIFRTLDALRVFDAIWVMTKGEFGTESMATYTYRQIIAYQRLGFGSAASVAIFLLIAAFVVVYVQVVRLEEQ